MATKGTPDVYLLFGLKGGDSITEAGSSGKLIKDQLTKIINDLEDKIVFSLKKINADEALKQLTTDVNNTLDNISKKSEVSLNIKFNENSVKTAITSLERKIKETVGANINVTPNITVVAGNGNAQVSTSTKSSNNTAGVNSAISDTQKAIGETKKNVENASNVTKEFVDVINKFVRNSVAEIKKSMLGTIDVPTKYNLRPIEKDDLKAIFSTWNKYLGSQKEISAKDLKDKLDTARVDIFGNTLTGKTKNKAKDIQEIINQLIRNYSEYFSLSLDDGLKLEPRGFGQTLAKDKTFGSTIFKDAKNYQKEIGEIVKLLNLDVSNNKVTIGLKQLADLVDQIVSDDAEIIRVKNDLSDLLSNTISESLSANPKAAQAAKTILEKKEEESSITADSTISKVIKQDTTAVVKETEEAKQDVKELESSAVSVAENVEKTVEATTKIVEKATVSIDDIEKAVNEKIKFFTSKAFKDVGLNDRTYFEDMALNLTDDIKTYRANSSMDGTTLDSSQLSQLYTIINNLNSLQGAASVFNTISEIFRNGKSFETTLNKVKEILYSYAFPKLSSKYKFDELGKYSGQGVNDIYKALLDDNDGTTYRNILQLKTLVKYLSNKDATHTIEGFTSYLNSTGQSYIGKKNTEKPYDVKDVETMLSQLYTVLNQFYKDVETIKIDESENISYNKDNVADIINSHDNRRKFATDISKAVSSDEYKAIENLFTKMPEKIEPAKEAVSEVKTEITPVATVAESLKETAQEVAATAKPAVDSVKDKVEEVAQAEQKATDNAEKLTEQIAQTDDKAVPALDNVENKLKEFNSSQSTSNRLADISRIYKELYDINSKKKYEVVPYIDPATERAKYNIPKDLRGYVSSEMATANVTKIVEIYDRYRQILIDRLNDGLVSITQKYIKAISPADLPDVTNTIRQIKEQLALDILNSITREIENGIVESGNYLPPNDDRFEIIKRGYYPPDTNRGGANRTDYRNKVEILRPLDLYNEEYASAISNSYKGLNIVDVDPSDIREATGEFSAFNDTVEESVKDLEELEKVFKEFERNDFKNVIIGDLYGQDAVDAAREIVKTYKDLNGEEIAFLKGDINGDSGVLAESGVRDEILSKFMSDYQEYQYYKNKESQDISNTSDEINKLNDTVEEVTNNLKEYKDATDDAAESTDKLGNAAEKSKNKIPKSLDNHISKIRGKRDNVEYELGLYDISNPTPTIMLYEELYNRIVKLRDAMDSDDYSSLDGINNYDEALQETNALLSQADELYKKVKEDLKLYSNEARAAEIAAQSATLIAREFPTGANAANFDDDTYSLARMERRFATAIKNLNNLESSQLVGDPDEINTLYDRLIRVHDLIDQLKSGAFTENSDVADAVAEINRHLGITEQRIKEIVNTTTNVPTDAMSSIVERYNKALAEYRATPGADKFKDLFQLDFIDTSDIANIEAARPRVVALTKETERLTKAKADLDNASKRESTTAARVNEIYQKAYDYYNKYYTGISRNKDLDNRWTTLLKDLNNGMYGNNAEGARQALTELQVQSKQANVEVTGLWDNLKKLFSAHFGSFSILTIIGSIRNGLRSMYQDVLEIDKAMTELRKVTDLTEQQYEAFGETAARIARSVSGSISDTINSVADFARLGFNVDEASSLAEAALVYKNVGDGLSDINEASESIISTIKAFSDIDASNAMSIIDKFNEVGLRNSCPRHDSRKNKWLITVSVKGWRQLRPRKDIMFEDYY